MKTRPRIHQFLLIAVICLVLGPVQLRAQVDEEEVAATRDTAWLTIEASSGKGTSVDLVLPSKVSDPQRLENALNKSFSFALNLKRRSSADFEGQEFEEDQEGEDLPFEWTSFAGRNDKAFVREGLQSTCHIDFAPLLEALKAEHIEHLKFGLVLINTHEQLSVEGLKNISSQHGLSYFRKDITVRAPELIGFDLSSGYSTRQVLNSVSMIVLFTALPGLCLLGLNLWNRKRLTEPDQIWGRHLRFLNRSTLAVWIIWLPVNSFSEISNILLYALGLDRFALAQLLGLVVYFIPPIASLLLCHLLSSGTYRRVTGATWSPRAVVVRLIVASGLSLMPLLLMVLVLNSPNQKLSRVGVLGAAGCVVWFLSNLIVGKVLRPRMYAVTSGEFRDRIFELANKAGVLLKQIYVLPDDGTQLANAFARSDNSVMITHSLLKNLKRAEVDAIMAHEIAHLKEHHPRLTTTISIITIIFMTVVISTVFSILEVPYSSSLVCALAIAIATLILFLILRRNERRADALSVALTGDPESLITGLTKLSRLNLIPLGATAWSEVLETHPRTLRRFDLIAKSHSISQERVAQLLLDPFATVAESYPVVATNEGNATIFSSEFKSKYRLRIGLSLIAVIMMAPISVAIFLERADLSVLQTVIAALIGSLFAFAVYQLVRNKIAFWGHKSLIRGLKSLLEKRGLSDVVDKGTFVALSPAGETQKYEEYLFWDAGVLWLTKEELYYSGEQTEFAIKREQVRNISVRKTRPQWLAEKALYLEWQEDQDTPLRTVHFLAIGASSVLSSRRAIESQKTRFDAWLNETGNFSDDLKAKAPVGHPSFPFVTSTLANTGFHSGLVLKAAFQLAIYGVVVSVAFQLSSLSVVYVATVIFCNTFLDELPKAFDRSRVKTEQPVSVPQYQPGSFVHSNQVESVDSVD